MPTSGTSTFTLDLREIVEDAFERCGLTIRSGLDYRSARRSFDLLTIEWSNRGTNFWKLEVATTALAAGTQTVTLDPTVLDVIETYTRLNAGTVNQSDLHVKPIGMDDYANLPTKNSRGRPVNVWVDKRRDAPVLTLWPVPDQAYTLVYHQLVRIEDSGLPATNNADVPWRFLPALVAGLAVHIARKKAPDRLQDLKLDYEEVWAEAVGADRERRATYFAPNLNPYRL